MLNHSQINEFVTIELVNGILIGSLKSKTIDLNLAKATVTYRLKQFDDKDYPLLINIKTVNQTTKEARDYLASKEGCHKVTSCAIIINSSITKIMANLFIRINKPLVPTKVFTSEETAKQWLSNYIN